jgi:peptidoglycan/xylan/chitin deacetylase (PgdA/CDA1 family)
MPRTLALVVGILFTVLAASACASERADHGVILVYHHVSTETPPSTSVAPERFAAHLEYLDDNGFEVWALPRLLEAIFEGSEPVPENVVAITFDDAYESVYTTAWPMLRERGWPFAVFANTDAIDAGHEPYLDWPRLRELVDAGAVIGNHSASHAHLIARGDGETRRQWRERVRSDLERSRARIEDEIGTAPRLFAYPYGEDSQALAELVGAAHDYALAQRSGAVGPLSDRLSIPRFPMASGFDDIDRFALAVDSRPLPVTAAQPAPGGDGVRGPIDSLRLTLAEGGYRAGQLACFSGSGRRLETTLEAGPPHRLDIAVDRRGSIGRNKINCTAPAADGSGDYFWYSFQWVQEAVRD